MNETQRLSLNSVLWSNDWRLTMAGSFSGRDGGLSDMRARELQGIDCPKRRSV